MLNRNAPAPEEALYQVPSLERALALLEALARQTGGLTLTELTDVLEIPKNSVFRITSTLLTHGYLYRDPDSRRFCLTWKWLPFGYAAMNENNLVEMARDAMRTLRDSTGETVLLGVRLEDEGIVLDQAPGTHSIKLSVDPGTRFRLHTSAPGKAILAYLPRVEQEALLKRLKLTRYTERAIATVPALIECLEGVRKLGYAVDQAEEYEGIHCVGAPVLDHAGSAVAAIWVTAPSCRLTQEQFAGVGTTVREFAASISRRLGFGLTQEVREPNRK
jgi:DNA-binding IclR family transcriptional regulator